MHTLIGLARAKTDFGRSILDSVEDAFRDDPITDTSVVLDVDHDWPHVLAAVQPFVQRHGLPLISIGLARTGYVLTFPTLTAAARFQQHWPGL